MACKWCERGECWMHDTALSGGRGDFGGFGKASGGISGGSFAGKGRGKGNGKLGSKLGGQLAMIERMQKLQMIERMQTMMGMMGMSKGSGPRGAVVPHVPQGHAPQGIRKGTCSIHGKKRKLDVLEDDGMGGLVCRGGFECQLGDSGEGSARNSGVCVCSVHGKNRSFMSLEDDGEGGMKCKETHQCQLGSSGADSAAQAGTILCSTHGKMRSLMSLEDDGMGGYKCKMGFQCQGAFSPMEGWQGAFGQKGGDRGGPVPTGIITCAIHGKPRSLQSMEPFNGGFKCKMGFECKTGGRASPY